MCAEDAGQEIVGDGVCHGGGDQGGGEPAVVQDSFGEVKEVVSDLTGRAAT